MEITVTVEIPKGSANKYEANHETGEIWLDRHLFTATRYPADYGFMPHTLAEDGDPLDVMVLLEEPTFPGCRIRARPVAVFWMRDEHGPDAKILAVPCDPRFEDIHDIGDLPDHLLREIKHFFTVYKDLEPTKYSDTREWAGRGEAEAEIAASIDRFERRP